MIIMIDNYDSFTYNLVQEFAKLGAEMTVYRNDKITIDELEALKPTALIVSPGPCTPTEAGISVDVIKRFSGRLPLLGVCLGHQSIVQALGGKIIRSDQIMHGKTSDMKHNEQGLFKGVENPFIGGRYHSLIAEKHTLPDCFEITCESDDGDIQGIRHLEHPTVGIQFHPESVLTPSGPKIMQNFLNMI